MTYKMHCEHPESRQSGSEHKGEKQIESLIAENALKTKESTDGSSLVQTHCKC